MRNEKEGIVIIVGDTAQRSAYEAVLAMGRTRQHAGNLIKCAERKGCTKVNGAATPVRFEEDYEGYGQTWFYKEGDDAPDASDTHQNAHQALKKKSVKKGVRKSSKQRQNADESYILDELEQALGSINEKMSDISDNHDKIIERIDQMEKKMDDGLNIAQEVEQIRDAVEVVQSNSQPAEVDVDELLTEEQRRQMMVGGIVIDEFGNWGITLDFNEEEE